MMRYLSSCCLILLLGCSFNSTQAASLSELLGLDEVLDAAPAVENVGGFSNAALLNATLGRPNAAAGSLNTSVVPAGGCAAPIFSTTGSPIIGGSIGGSIINISINIDIDITFVGSYCQPVTSATRCSN